MSAESSPEPPQLVDLASESKQTEAFGALGDLEFEFEKAEVEVLKFQIATTAPLYARRNLLTSQITSFWPTVFDSTPEFDQHIAPKDVSAISTITSLNVIRPNSDEPRDIIIELGFDKERNEWFEGDVLTKRFWWKTVEGWSGLVSEPVEIAWKEGKDLSNGETSRVYAEWKSKKNQEKNKNKNKGKGKGKVAANATAASANGKEGKLSLEERLAGGQPSFFTWFAWMGKGTDYGVDGKGGDEDEDEEESDDLFNHGDELAMTIAEDLYPNAIKYFLESVTVDEEADSEMSVSELGSDEEIVVIGGEEDDSEDSGDDGIGSSRVKRVDITLDSEEEEEEDEGNRRRKRVKK